MLYSYLNYINLLPWLAVFQVLMFVDCLLNRSIKGLSKGKWFVIMFILQGLGSFIYFVCAPSLLFTSFLNVLVSFKQNATTIQTFIYRQQRKCQPSQPKLQSETTTYPSQLMKDHEHNLPQPTFYNTYELPYASYPTIETITPEQQHRQP